jgi:hypothetical protein
VRFLPETADRADWPRLVAQTVNALVRRNVNWADLPDHADDAAAATGGVPIGGLYRTGSIIKVRIS